MKSPLLGFNNNVRHKGRVFHIQTEDSGVNRPHIITHLFADGGRILKTTKTSYAEHVGAENMAETVTTMMKDQHKAMFTALRDGQYDHLIDAPTGPRTTGVNQVPVMPPTSGVNQVPTIGAFPPSPSVPPATSSQPGLPPPSGPNAVAIIPAATSSQPGAPVPPPPAAAAAPPPPPQPPRPPAAAAAAAPPAPGFKPPAPPGYVPPPPPAATPPPSATPPPATSQRSPSRPAFPNADAVLSQRPSSRPALNALRGEGAPPDASFQARMQPERPVDLEALERAAQEVQTPFFQQMQDLPPPPAAVLAKKPSGSHSSATFRAVSPDSVPRAPSEPPANPGASRYAQPRPAAVFGGTRPSEGVSIFGEDLISEKSLDEVILSYLAEDLDTPEKK
ncbi:MAG TPA: hypothetical protein VE093_10700 [Polyangiaceae bacterium]|nr:hypothetical protein [Polyangiaceae bacterium]